MDAPSDLAGSGLDALADPALAPLFETPARRDVVSAWYGHLPFAAWIVRAVRPSLLVELGTHAGVSYAGFCEAVLRDGLNTRCVAVDTWKGDEHADFYGEEVFTDLSAFHAQHYAAFSTMRRATFDEAVADFEDGSIDLLHIDGRHFYEDVRHDFETWRPKLSSRAVVLFHDTQVRERGFGVWRLWSEIAPARPHFEFTHAHGLGVLAYGQDIAPAVATLCGTRGTPMEAVLRDRFALLGRRWSLAFENQMLEKDAEHAREAYDKLRQAEQNAVATAVAAQAAYNATEAERQRLAASGEALSAQLAAAEISLQRLTEDHEALLSGRSALLSNAQAMNAQRLAAEAAHDAALAARARAEQERLVLDAMLRQVLGSRSWQGVATLRRFVGRGGGATLADIPVVAAAPSPRPRRILFASGEPDTPGHIYRVARYAEAARSIGWDSHSMSVVELNEDAFAGVGVVVFWRVRWSGTVDHAYHLARRAGAVVVFDIDNLMVRPELARADIIDGIRTQGFDEAHIADFYAQAQAAMLRADVCTCMTEELAEHLRAQGKTTFVLPNGFDEAALQSSRRAVQARRMAGAGDGLVRIGYAAGTRTYQRDLMIAASGLVRLLRARPECRLVLFHAPTFVDGRLDPATRQPLVDIKEIGGLSDVVDQIEWRALVPLAARPTELARFDINIAPIEVGNPYCEAKSEPKYFEAALVSVPTVASPTGPFRRAIADGDTGFLAADDNDWFTALDRLAGDPALRARIGRAAFADSIERFGPAASQHALLSALNAIAI